MKKLLVLLMSAALVCTLASCADAGNDNADSLSTAATQSEQDSSPNTDDETVSDDIESASSPLAILTAVWDTYGEDERFAVFGGDMTEENMTMGAPGKYSLDDPEALDSSLGFPAASADTIDDAASLIHMMNANTFTCGAYHVIDQEDMDGTISAIKDNILNRQWMCGFPEKLVIITADDCIIALFGHTEPVDTFKDKLTAAYPSAQLVSENPIQ